MNIFDDLQHLATRRTFLSAIVALCLATSASPARADRQEDFAKLETEFDVAGEKFQADHRKENPTDADRIRNVEDYHLWTFIPRFLALAEANPEDDTAFRCCQWIIEKNPGFAGDRAKFDAEQKAWAIVAAHHVGGDRVPEICLEAAQAASPHREKFLRDLLRQPDLSHEHTGFATLALADLLANKIDDCEAWQRRGKQPFDDVIGNHVRSRYDPEFVRYLSETKIDATKEESAKLFRVVLELYGNVPSSVSTRHYRNITTLGEKAQQSLHALEHLTVGAEAPDIIGQDLNGQPLRLKDYRGRVVVLSFWFTGCGPCMALIPKEQKLVEKFKDRPFALLGVCRDEDVAMGQKTAADEKISWPCWFDGKDRAIQRDYNIIGWPTLYLIDQDGRILDKNIHLIRLEETVAEALNKSKPENSLDLRPKNVTEARK